MIVSAGVGTILAQSSLGTKTVLNQYILINITYTKVLIFEMPVLTKFT